MDPADHFPRDLTTRDPETTLLTVTLTEAEWRRVLTAAQSGELHGFPGLPEYRRRKAAIEALEQGVGAAAAELDGGS